MKVKTQTNNTLNANIQIRIYFLVIDIIKSHSLSFSVSVLFWTNWSDGFSIQIMRTACMRPLTKLYSCPEHAYEGRKGPALINKEAKQITLASFQCMTMQPNTHTHTQNIFIPLFMKNHTEVKAEVVQSHRLSLWKDTRVTTLSSTAGCCSDVFVS